MRLDLNRAVLVEVLACVLVRARWYETRNKPLPQITMVALQVLCEALGIDPREAG